MEVDLLNRTRQRNSLACYTRDWGNSTGTTEQGVEIIIKEVTYPFRPDKEITGIIQSIKTGNESVNNQIPDDGLVLSAREEKGVRLLKNVKSGGRIYIHFDITPSIFSNANLFLTGAGYILKNGAKNPDAANNWGESFADTKHPRTVLAWNEEFIFMIVVDGRQIKSQGMTFSGLIEFLSEKLEIGRAKCR